MATNLPARRGKTRMQLLAELEGAQSNYASQGAAATGAYLDKAQNFDASGALNTFAQGAWNTIGGQLKRSIADERGRSVGAGRLDTGFYDEDVGDLYRGATGQLTDALAGQSMNALSATQRNTEGLRAFGENATDRATGMTQAMWEHEENDYREAEERKRRNRRGIGSALGGLAGGIIGSVVPGIGTSIGAGLGSAVGGAFGR